MEITPEPLVDDADALRALVAAEAPRAEMKVLPGITHFGIFSDPATLDMAAAWLRGLPEGKGHQR